MSKNPSRKKIALIYDDHHPLLEKICERLLELGGEPSLLTWRSLSLGAGLSNPLDQYSAVYLDRMGERTPSYTTQMSLLEDFTDRPVVNRAKPYAVARNKALTARKLNQLGLPTPSTAIIYTHDQLNDFQRANPSEFYIAKSIFGCCAYDILTIHRSDRSEELDKLLERDGMAVVQTFIHNPQRFIWRVDIVNDQVIVANQRFAYNAESEAPICNGTQGGAIEFWQPSQLPSDVRDLALKATSGLELSVAGVDLLPDEHGNLFILEVNPEPDITMDRFEFPFAIANHLWSLT